MRSVEAQLSYWRDKRSRPEASMQFSRVNGAVAVVGVKSPLHSSAFPGRI